MPGAPVNDRGNRPPEGYRSALVAPRSQKLLRCWLDSAGVHRYIVSDDQVTPAGLPPRPPGPDGDP